MSDVRPRIRAPRDAAAGSSVNIRTLISHPMESGTRRDSDGTLVPRQIINRFACTFNGRSVIDMDIEPGVSANPYIEFDAVVDQSGTFEFTWHDDDGTVYSATHEIAVS